MAQLPIPSRQHYRNIHVTQIVRYRLPPSGWVSILHRVSGALLFLLMPAALWMFDASLTSEVTFDGFAAAFRNPLVKFVALVLLWAYLFHFIAGVRHLWMDLFHGSVDKKPGRVTALATLVLSTLLTLVLGAKLLAA